MSADDAPREGEGGEVVPFRPRRGDAEPVHDTSYEVVLDDETGGEPVPVHDGAGIALPPLEGERRAIWPAHLRTPAAIGKEIARRAEGPLHEAAFQAVRSPWTAAQLLWWASWGAILLSGRLIAYVAVSEQAPLRSQAVISGDSREYRALHVQRQKIHEYRRIVAGIGAFGVLLAGVLIARFAPWWAWVLVAGVAVPLLARAGMPPGKPIFTPSMVTPRVRILSADKVLHAYYRAKLGDPGKPGEQVTFGSPMARDGEGSRVVVDLPAPLGLEDAMKAKPGIASGLDVSLSQVFIHRDPTSYRRHVLWVADRDPLAVPVGRTPLLACKATDIWRPAPLGLDERGQLVSLLLMWQSVLVGALPRQGKTFAARLLGLYAGLDPYVKLHVFDPSGKPDWRDFALVADTCAFGLTPTREGLPPEILLRTLEFIRDDVQDRYNRLSALPRSVCPQGKLTREIARDPRYGMPVRGLFLDEFQEYFDLGAISKEIASLLVFISKVAPGAGVFLVDATQKPSGIGSGEVAKAFISARDNHQVRFSLRTSSYAVSEMVLGQGAYGEGLDSSTLLPGYKGVGILRGASDASPTVRTHLAEGDDAEKILKAARALRERAGTLSGMAAGAVPDTPERDVLADVLHVFGGDTQLHWELLASRLERQHPERWADATGAAVSQQCRDLGVRSADVRWPPGRQGTVRKGCYQRDVAEAAARSTAGEKP